jgi:hypothetical protein
MRERWDRGNRGRIGREKEVKRAWEGSRDHRVEKGKIVSVGWVVLLIVRIIRWPRG